MVCLHTLCCFQGTSYMGADAGLDLQQLLPANQSYASYAGSLTTPPCTEGVLWVMMLNTQKLSLNQVQPAGPTVRASLAVAQVTVELWYAVSSCTSSSKRHTAVSS
jgi:carbonic anhydrase